MDKEFDPRAGRGQRSAARKKASELSRPLESRQEALAPTPRQLIPDGCNLSVVFRALAGINALVFLVAMVAQADSGLSLEQGLRQFLLVCSVLEPVVLLTLIAWCGLRRLLANENAWRQRLASWAVPALITGLLVALFQREAGSADVFFFHGNRVRGGRVGAALLGAARPRFFALGAGGTVSGFAVADSAAFFL